MQKPTSVRQACFPARPIDNHSDGNDGGASRLIGTNRIPDEDFSSKATPSPREILNEAGRILLCSLGLAALVEICARVAGFK